MKNIKIFDTTLRDGEQSPGCSMNLLEKIEMARQLERLGVDVIEAGFAISSPGDFESVRAIAETMKKTQVASLSRAVEGDIRRSADALKGAVNPLIHTFIATSDLHLKYKLKRSRDQVLDTVTEMVALAKSLCDNVEFSAEDASRSDIDFLCEVFGRAIAAGATVLNVPDTVGYSTPDEMYEIFKTLSERVKGIENVALSTHNHNDLGLGVANSLAAVRGGATQIECTVNGIGERAGNAALEEVAMALATRQGYFNAFTNLDTTQIYRTSRLLSHIIGVAVVPNKAIVGANAFAHESGIHQHGVLANRETYEIMTPESVGYSSNKMVLGKHSGRHAFCDRLDQLGFSLSKEEQDDAFAKFKLLCDKKKTITDKDLEAIVDNHADTAEERLALESFVVNAGTHIDATATIKLKKDGGDIIIKTALGRGQVEAAYNTIDQITGFEPILEDYHVNSVSEGEDAQGEVSVKLSHGGRIFHGRGVSLDVIEASILAYINGINKIYENK